MDSGGWQDVNLQEFWGDVSAEPRNRPTGTYPRSDEQETLDSPPIGDETFSFYRKLYAILVQTNRARQYELYRVDKTRVVIGRAKSDGVGIAVEDRAVSNPHCKLVVERDENGNFKHVSVEDLESENGTWVNGKLVNQAVLKDRDVLKLGETELLFIQI